MKACFNTLMGKVSERGGERKVYTEPFGRWLHPAQVSWQWPQDPECVPQNTGLGNAALQKRLKKKFCPGTV